MKKFTMTDDEMYRVLEDFGNSHTLAQDIVVNVSPNSRGMKAKDIDNPKCNYEDACLLMDILRGAEHFLMWARRNNKIRMHYLKRKKK